MQGSTSRRARNRGRENEMTDNCLEVCLVEPPIVALPCGSGVSFHLTDDGVVIRVGLARQIGADTIEIPYELLPTAAATLTSVARKMEARRD
jgi:hypothetical protein